jgi:hypothetical protein
MTRIAMSPAGKAKVLKTQRRILDALASLSVAAPAAKLNITAVCGKAGVSPDALALEHHAKLKATVERSILEHNSAHFGKSRRTANLDSDVAMSRIERLEQELADLRVRYGSAVQSVRELALSLECALAEIEQLRFPAVDSKTIPFAAISGLKE